MTESSASADWAPAPARCSTVYEPALLPGASLSGARAAGLAPSADDAARQLLQNNETEYRRYTAARAVRALRESDDEKPASGELRQLVRQAALLGRWRRRRRPALLRSIAAQRDPELPDDLQSPLPPHSRWIFDSRANVFFNAFTGASNPVEDFYLLPQDDVWRSHRYGVYGLRYKGYPNASTTVAPHDGAGLYYRPNKKILTETESGRPAAKPGVVTLDHVKRVATRAVGQFFPKVHGKPTFFEWPHIDDVLGSIIEYFHHYFELRRAEETMAQLQCQMCDSTELDGRRLRMDECVTECGKIYSTYLLGFDMPFHHLKQGSGYKSAAASDRQIFEAFYAFVAQCVWIVYRRPNVTVIARELGRLFRTAGFDPARRAEPPPTELPDRSVTSGQRPASARPRNAGRQPTGGGTRTAGRQPASGRQSTSAQQQAGNGQGTSDQPQASGRQGTSDQQQGGARQGESSQQQASAQQKTSGRQATPDQRQAGGQQGAPDQQQSSGRQRPADGPAKTSRSRGASNAQSAAAGSRQSPDGRSAPSEPGNSPPASARRTPTESPAGSSRPDSAASASSPTAGRLSPEPSAAAAAADGGASPASGEPAEPAPATAHVSMKKVYGLYTGPAPPHGAIFGLLGGTSQVLRQSLAVERHPAGAPSRLRADRSRLGIIGTPLKNYDDVLAAIDYERELKERRLQFLGPSSKKAGVSRVAGVIPYLLLPSKFFSPDA